MKRLTLGDRIKAYVIGMVIGPILSYLGIYVCFIYFDHVLIRASFIMFIAIVSARTFFTKSL